MGDDRKTLYVILTGNASDYDRMMDRSGTKTDAFGRKVESAGRDVDTLGKKSDSTGKEIDKMSGRLAIFIDLAAAIGPALIPIGAVGIPAVAGLTQQLGFAVLAGGTLMGAMQGVGTAVKALEKARLDPTDASIKAAQLAMEQLGPDAQQFALQVQNRVLPQLRELRDSAAAGWFPGMTQSIDDFEKLAPRIDNIVSRVSKQGGRLVAEGAASLAGPEWDDFWKFIQNEAPKDIAQLGHTVGDLTHGLAELWVAFGPMNNDFADGFEKRAKAFDAWATALDETQGFKDFSAYIKETGPEVLDFLGATADMFIQIVEAAAPLGGPTLKILTAVANIIGDIADSDMGTPIMALLSLTSTLRLLDRAAGGIGPKFAMASRNVKQFGADVRVASFGMDYTQMDKTAAATSRVGEKLKGLGKGALVLGGISLAASGATDKVGLTNTTLMGMSGLMLGPWGAAIGTGIGFLMDLEHAADSTHEAMLRLSGINQNDPAELEKSRAALQSYVDSWQGKLNWKGSADAARSAIAGIDERLSSLDQGQKVKGLGFLFRETLSNSVQHADETVQQFANDFEHLNSLLQKRGSLIAYESALDALSASIKENGNTWSIGTEKGRANLTLADQLTQQAIARANILKNAGDNEGASKMLQRTIGNLKDFASTSKAAHDALQPLIDQLEKIDKKNPKPTLDADATPLHGKTKDANAALDGVDKKHPKPKIDADHRIIMGKVHTVDDWLDSIDSRTPTPHIGADDSELVGKAHTGLGLLHLLDGFHATPTVRADTGQLFGVFGAIQQAMRNIDGMTATTTIRTIKTTSLGPRPDADGGIYQGRVRTFADGGYGQDGRYYRREPQIVKGGANVLWGEQETGWEAYISGKPTARSRNVQILQAAAGRFGYDLRPRGHEAGTGGRTVVVKNAFPDRVDLVVDGGSFKGYVRGHARQVADDRTLQHGDAEALSERSNWP